MSLWLDNSLTYDYGEPTYKDKGVMYFIPAGEIYWAKPRPKPWGSSHWKTTTHAVVYDSADRLDLVKLNLITQYDHSTSINPPIIADKLSGMNVWKDMYYGFRLPENKHGCQYLIFNRNAVQELPYGWRLRDQLLRGRYTPCAKNSCGKLIKPDEDIYCKLHSKNNLGWRKKKGVAP